MKHNSVICNVDRNEMKLIHGDHFRGERHYIAVLRDAPAIGDREPPAIWEPYRCDTYVRLASVRVSPDTISHFYFYEHITAAAANKFLVGNGII